MLVSRAQSLPREGGAESSESGGGKRGKPLVFRHPRAGGNDKQ